MEAKRIVQTVNLGASVAEFDSNLEQYFVETETFRSVISDRGDIIAGDKGTGKTAIYRILKKNYRSYPELSTIEIVDAFNPTGDPVFQRLLAGPELNEGQYRTFWKAYIFSLVGNWILDVYPADYNDEIKSLSDTIEFLDLKSTDVTPETIFGRLHGLVRRLTDPSALETEISFTDSGMPIIKPRIELGSGRRYGEIIYNGDFLRVLDMAIASTDLKIWVLFDRLDEAFSGSPEIEIPALRALMRSYLDLTGLDNIRLKLFLRKDLFRRIVTGGFVNLTHINARRIEIVWDDDDLISMVSKRLMQNLEFTKVIGEDLSADRVFSILLPPQIDVGDRKPSTKKWIMGRIRDGNNNRPPRNIIDLLNKARDSQLRREQRDERQIDPGKGPILEAESMKRAFAQLSEQRVQDTLLAEANELVEAISRFRDGKSEHNQETLKEALTGIDDYSQTVKALVDIGFLEEFGSNYKIPMVYREGLKIRQGKAYLSGGESEEETNE